MNRWLNWILLAALTGLPGVAAAEPPAPALTTGTGPTGTARSPAAEPAAAATLHRRPLAELMTENRPLRLSGTDGTETLTLPLPARWQVQEARLQLVYANSISLLPGHSQLRVELNGLVIAQLPLDPQRPEGQAQVRLPVELLEPGYNRLRFAVAQHVEEEWCEDPGAPELWTQVDTVRSVLTLRTTPAPLSPSLAQLEDIIDARLWEPYRLTVLTSPEAEPAQRLRWGALAAQGSALRLNYQSPRIDAGELDGLTRRTGDTLLAGTVEQLAPRLGQTWAATVTGPYLGVFPRSDLPGRFQLVIAGRDAAQVDEAATAFAFPNRPLPDRPWAVLEGSPLPPPALMGRDAPMAVEVAGRYAFRELGFASRSLRGTTNSTREVAGLDLRLPADLFASPESDVILSLHLAFGADMRADSVLNVHLNGTFENVLPLNDDNGGFYRRYELRIPLTSFRPGFNRLTFEPVLVPSQTDHCQLRQTGNLLLTIFDDSQLLLPGAGRFAQLPDLELLARGGYPLVRQPDGSALAVQVADDPDAFAAAWTLLGRLAQIQGRPLHRALLDIALEPGDRELLVIGPRRTLERQWLTGSPLLAEPGDSTARFASARVEPDWQQAMLEWLADRLLPRPPQSPPPRITPPGPDLGRFGALSQFQSPNTPGRSVLLITAEDGPQLRARVQQLVQPALWNNLKGDTAFWADGADSLRWARLVPDWQSGDGDPAGRLSFYFTRNPHYLLGAALGLLLVIALLTLVMLRAFRRRRHPRAES